MARFFSTLIEQNILGDGTQEVTASNASTQTSLNQLLANVGGEKYIIGCINLFSSNVDQLRQPIVLKKDDINGNTKRDVIVPSIDSYQKQSILNDVGLKSFNLDENSGLEYKLLANSSVKMTLNLEAKKRIFLSNAKMLKEQLGIKKDLKSEVLGDIDIPEPEELKKSACSQREISEPEEIKKAKRFKKPKKIKKIKKKEEKITIIEYDYKKDLIKLAVFTGLGILLISLDKNNKYFKL